MSSIPLLFPKSAGKKFASLVGGKGFLSKARAVATLRPRDFVPDSRFEIRAERSRERLEHGRNGRSPGTGI